ncbi:dihydropteroate synthase [Pseudobacteroides cellulosolvens]|uniref:Dihydropteroate synthase n=1 Tax=Pseudobacteroides cellulosolvens ATCC 35603 = DSM 2933 TaxID=398512 RepID=A0A0L6JNR5_9FIRM|nr:dihydropteroate synthase [Pseudobacteroides cellulosolvens]KNY27419.1 dihydropteroate synthase [Pseudobacteroides cellulosolvens ATCC 35603 = DSM 2933]
MNKTEVFICRDKSLAIGKKTYIMGILNITPDSFSDGGKYYDVDDAINRAREMIVNGADIIDVGGESTRPGFQPVEPIEEIRRVVPIIERLSREFDIPISIDTSKAMVAKEALRAGAHIVNDIWGLQVDENMASVVSEYGAGIVMMHNRQNKEYTNLMADIIDFLQRSIKIAQKAGIKRDSMAIDPGIGFGKTFEHNLQVIKDLEQLGALQLPILLGTSRKGFIGNILDLPVDDRVEGTGATVAIGIAYGADIVRVHDVKEMARTARMADAIIRR